MHRTDCRDCRAKLQEGEAVWGVKNAATHEYRHVVARSCEEAKEILGWNGSTLYTLLVRSWCPPMTDRLKGQLTKLREERRRLRKPARS